MVISLLIVFIIMFLVFMFSMPGVTDNAKTASIVICIIPVIYLITKLL